MREEDQIDMMHDSHALWQEISRLNAELAQLDDEVAKANAQRDEARREVCECKWMEHSFDVLKYALMRGWDCFDAKEAKPA